MRFGVLGPLAVWTDDGTPVAVPGLKVRALLADLLAHEGRPVPADRLIDDLWAGALPGSPAGALSAKVSQLRRVLEDAEAGARALVATRPAGYVLEVAPERVDAQAFRSLLSRALDTGGPAARAAMLGEALARWRGPAFADFADEPFVRSAVAALEELRLVALEEQAEARLALGEHALVAVGLVELVAAHPFRERLRAAQLLALYRSGRQREALESYERLRAELSAELGMEPGPDLVALRAAIVAGDRGLTAPKASGGARRSRPRTNLPAPSGDLIGREAAVAELTSELAIHRLVTLTGPGGVGKTRLAVEMAARQADALPDGAWLVDLAPCERSDQRPVIDAVARALDVRDAPGRTGPVAPVERLADALRPRLLLLVLDSCERVAGETAELLAVLLQAAPGLRVLATSREPLGLAGEAVWSVPPLDVPAAGAPAEPAVLMRSSAVRLFVARARAAARGFRLDAGSAASVAELCRRLDGIPLALELAATRVRALGVHGLVARLDDRFRALASGPRGLPRRHRTLHAVIDWSWALLSDREQAVLRRLAVHVDGCSLEAAEAVSAGDGIAAGDVLDALVRLVDCSLVVMTDRDLEAPRYRLLESVAAFCLDRMEEVGEVERVRLRHRGHYLELAERAQGWLYGHAQTTWLRLLDAEAGNLRAALDGAVADGHGEQALGLVNALAWYWFLRGRLAEAQRSLASALAAPGEPSARRATAMAWHAGSRCCRATTPAGPAGGQRRCARSRTQATAPARPGHSGGWPSPRARWTTWPRERTCWTARWMACTPTTTGGGRPPCTS